MPILGVVASSISGHIKPVVTGGTLVSDATYFYRLFTASGTLGISGASLATDQLIIAGGGGGGFGFGGNGGGGGGAGGVLGFASSLLIAGSYSCTVGGGGGGAVASSANGITGTGSSITGSTPTSVGCGTSISESKGPGRGGCPRCRWRRWRRGTCSSQHA